MRVTMCTVVVCSLLICAAILWVFSGLHRPESQLSPGDFVAAEEAGYRAAQGLLPLTIDSPPGIVFFGPGGGLVKEVTLMAPIVNHYRPSPTGSTYSLSYTWQYLCDATVDASQLPDGHTESFASASEHLLSKIGSQIENVQPALHASQPFVDSQRKVARIHMVSWVGVITIIALRSDESPLRLSLMATMCSVSRPLWPGNLGEEIVFPLE